MGSSSKAEAHTINTGAPTAQRFATAAEGIEGVRDDDVHSFIPIVSEAAGELR